MRQVSNGCKVPMTDYVHVSLDFGCFAAKTVDIRVPCTMRVKKCVQLLNTAYSLGLDVQNPTLKARQTGDVFFATMAFSRVKNGAYLYLEHV